MKLTILIFPILVSLSKAADNRRVVNLTLSPEFIPDLGRVRNFLSNAVDNPKLVQVKVIRANGQNQHLTAEQIDNFFSPTKKQQPFGDFGRQSDITRLRTSHQPFAVFSRQSDINRPTTSQLPTGPFAIRPKQISKTLHGPKLFLTPGLQDLPISTKTYTENPSHAPHLLLTPNSISTKTFTVNPQPQIYSQKPQTVIQIIEVEKDIHDTLPPEIEALTDLDWEQYKAKYNKQYVDAQEEYYRQHIFIQNKAQIRLYNVAYVVNKRTFLSSLNEFSDILPQEFIQSFTGFFTYEENDIVETPSTFVPSRHTILPPSIDWVEEGAVRLPVPHQLMTNSCWAFAAAGALEGHHFIKTGELVDISEQNLIDCTGLQSDIHGGKYINAFHYVRKQPGVDSEESYPYEAIQGQCRFKWESVVAKCTGTMQVQEYDEEMLMHAVAQGPVAVAIAALENGLQSYYTGIFSQPACIGEKVNHAVLIVGYGTENGKDYWKVRNSYGPGWGENGFFRIERGVNMCNIALLPMFPLV